MYAEYISLVERVQSGEGIPAQVEQSTICSLSSRALWSQTWLHKTTQEVASIGSTTRLIDALIASFCEAISGFVNLLSPKGKMWDVSLLLGGLQICQQILISISRGFFTENNFSSFMDRFRWKFGDVKLRKNAIDVEVFMRTSVVFEILVFFWQK